MVRVNSQDLTKSIQQWNDDPCVIGVSENAVIRAQHSSAVDDPHYKSQKNLQLIQWRESLDLFDRSAFKSTQPLLIAIVDSGIDDEHEDLADNMWSGPNGEHGQSFVSGETDTKDAYGHGTHCAGIVAAKSNNQKGVAGVLTGNVKLIAVKSLNSEGDGTVASVANGIRYAADRGADVINLSLGAPVKSATIEDALIYALNKGSVIVAASGNQGALITAENFYAPVGYAAELQGFIGVGSVDAVHRGVSGFSNYSSEMVEMATFGSAGSSKIVSTWPGGNYQEIDGTSMAAPLVAGAAGLVISFFKTHNISYTPALVESVLLNSSRKNKQIEDFIQQGRELQLLNLRRHLEANYLQIQRGGFDE